MKCSTKDQVTGQFHKVKGKLEEAAGDLTDNPKLEAEGTGEKIAGKVQEKVGQFKKFWASSESGISCNGVSLNSRQQLHD